MDLARNEGGDELKTHRLARVAEAIREVAAETILFELRDPRVKLVTVTRAEVSGDLQHAKVYVSVMGTEKEQALAMHGLRHAAGFVQSRLAKRLETRFTPVITFVLDEGVKKSIEMTRLIQEAMGPKADEALGGPGDGTSLASPEEEPPADGSAGPQAPPAGA
ncbi:MAG: 30S ribosome-binding factor RbfA [Gemmataceae bacterium]|nr:30S ribosome-binding factor RbfA [Gemmataceae bacterium]